MSKDPAPLDSQRLAFFLLAAAFTAEPKKSEINPVFRRFAQTAVAAFARLLQLLLLRLSPGPPALWSRCFRDNTWRRRCRVGRTRDTFS